MINPVYAEYKKIIPFSKENFSETSTGTPLFFHFNLTRDMLSFACAKFKKKSVRWKNLSYKSLMITGSLINRHVSLFDCFNP